MQNSQRNFLAQSPTLVVSTTRGVVFSSQKSALYDLLMHEGRRRRRRRREKPTTAAAFYTLRRRKKEKRGDAEDSFSPFPNSTYFPFLLPSGGEKNPHCSCFPILFLSERVNKTFWYYRYVRILKKQCFYVSNHHFPTSYPVGGLMRRGGGGRGTYRQSTVGTEGLCSKGASSLM